MFTPSWLSDQSLIQSLQQEPWRWQSAQVYRVLQNGGFQISQSTLPDYCFPASELIDVQLNSHRCKLLTTLTTLNGYYGVLPYVYQDIEIHQRLNLESTGFYDFCSVFNRRILNLVSELRLNSLQSVVYEKTKNSGHIPGKDILALCGLPHPRHVPAENLVRYAGRLTENSTSLIPLARILKDYFNIEFALKSSAVVKMPLAADALTQLCSHADHQRRSNACLGKNSLIGQSCYMLYSGLNVVIKANRREQYDAIINDVELAPAILEICAICFSSLVSFRLQIECPLSFLKPPRLSAKPDHQVARLGRLSCLTQSSHSQQLVTVDYPKNQQGEKV